jgi:segregation and condensation protein B
VSHASAIECLLFVAGEPLSLQDMARSLCAADIEAEIALRELQLRLGESGSGLQIVSIAGGYQLSTRPEYSETIGRLLARSGSKLSRAALESLAIIAYRQPITIPELESVRGVASGSVVKTLLDRRLILETGRRPTAGRPALYSTTRDFLHYFGINDLGELPQLGELEQTALPFILPDPAPSESLANPVLAEPDSYGK